MCTFWSKVQLFQRSSDCAPRQDSLACTTVAFFKRTLFAHSSDSWKVAGFVAFLTFPLWILMIFLRHFIASSHAWAHFLGIHIKRHGFQKILFHTNAFFLTDFTDDSHFPDTVPNSEIRRNSNNIEKFFLQTIFSTGNLQLTTIIHKQKIKS